jgi:UDP-GlcNAc:undecaprenyl-phosphate/decaprenyl-phosphate GlcNAc-1-phosphate transferase
VLLVLFLAAFGVSLLLTYRVRRWAVAWGLVDVPDQGRHDHARPVARAGGVAVFAAVVVVLGLSLGLRSIDGAILPPGGSALLVVLAGATGMFLLGLWDDARSLGPRLKFSIQILIAVGVFMAGVRIDELPLPGLADASLPTTLSLLVTVVWLVGVTNAFNLIDGSDGVAAGAAVLACLGMAGVSLATQNDLGLLVTLVLAGAALGFLFFNFPPASIFLGDSGSLFIGFMLAAVAVVTTQTTSTAIAVAIPVVSLGLPILDTTLVIIRRFLRRKPLFEGDRRHIHHVLRDLGNSPRRVALLIYALCGGFALLSMLLVQPGGAQLGIPFGIAGVILWVGIQRLRIPEIVELGRVMGRGLVPREVIAHNMRVRDAVARLHAVNEPGDVLAALESAFDGSEFHRAEMWLPPDVGEPLGAARSVRLVDGGCLWRWAAPARFREEAAFEVRLPFCDATGRRIGRLSLWRPLEGQHLSTDLRLIAGELLPALDLGLRRVRKAEAARLRPGPLVPVRPVVSPLKVMSSGTR